MHTLRGARQTYAWGSPTEIPQLLGVQPDGRPWAEEWFGAHPAGPTRLGDADRAGEAEPGPEPEVTLAAFLDSDPDRLLGEDVVRRFGPHLPFLLKLIAPVQALSLQVHPSLAQAAEGFELENEQGIALDSPQRSYRDTNHKPEMVMAVTRFEAVAGFRAPRRAAEVLAGLDTPLARRIRRGLRVNPTRFGIRQVFSELVSAGTRPSSQEVAELVRELGQRLESGESPSPRVDRNAVTMARSFPGDPGIAAALLLNPVTLQPGEALFVPAGSVHAYLGGLGVEIMASSDNVLRAGLSSKYVNVPAMLACVDYVAAPPVRPAPEYLSRATRAYYAPVDDFELLVTTVVPADGRVAVPGRGPRIVLALEGVTTLTTAAGSLDLAAGQAVFVGADEPVLWAQGEGTTVQADVP